MRTSGTRIGALAPCSSSLGTWSAGRMSCGSASGRVAGTQVRQDCSQLQQCGVPFLFTSLPNTYYNPSHTAAAASAQSQHGWPWLFGPGQGCRSSVPKPLLSPLLDRCLVQVCSPSVLTNVTPCMARARVLSCLSLPQWGGSCCLQCPWAWPVAPPSPCFESQSPGPSLCPIGLPGPRLPTARSCLTDAAFGYLSPARPTGLVL